MISSVEGILESIGADRVVIKVGGVGLQLQVPASALDSLGSLGSEVTLQTFLVIRDEAVTLYGFPTSKEKGLFELLVGVNGVGPKLALSALSVMSAEDAALAIVSGNLDALAKIPGVGRRTAGRIVLDLQSRMEREWGMPIAVAQQSHGELPAALGSLGYSAGEIRVAMADLGDLSEFSLEEQLRQALQRLAG